MGVLLQFEEGLDALGVSLESELVELGKLSAFVQDHDIFESLRCLFLELLVISSHLGVKGGPDFASLFDLLFGIIQVLFNIALVFLLFLVKGRHLCGYGVDLRVINILSALDIDHLVIFLVLRDLKLSPHGDVLGFEEIDMLMGSLLVIEQTTDAGVGLVVNHLLLQDFELKLHEVDLLLEVGDVLILDRVVGVLSEGIFFGFVLASELDSARGLVVGVLEDSWGCSFFRHIGKILALL